MGKSETSNVRRETGEAKECGLMGEYGGGMEDALSSGGKAEEQLLAGLESLNETTYAAILRPVDEVDLVDLVDKLAGKWGEQRESMIDLLAVNDTEVFAVFDEYPPFEKGVLQAMYDYLRTDCQLDTAKAFMMALNLGKAVFTIKRVVK